MRVTGASRLLERQIFPPLRKYVKNAQTRRPKPLVASAARLRRDRGNWLFTSLDNRIGLYSFAVQQKKQARFAFLL